MPQCGCRSCSAAQPSSGLYGTSFYTEAWQAATMIWAAALLLEARTAPRPQVNVAIAAILLAVTGLTKVTSLVFAPGFVVAALAETSLPQRRRLQVAAALAAGIAVATAGHLLWNHYRFGSIARLRIRLV